MAGRGTIAFVEFKPIGGHGVGHGGIDAGDACVAAAEHRRLVMACALDHPAVETRHFRLVARTDHRGQIVGQHGRGTRQHRPGNVGQLAAGRPVDQLPRGRGDLDLAHAHDIALAKSEAR